MKRIVLVFGLIAGAIMSATMVLAFPFHDALGSDRGVVLGYTSMVLAFLLIFFGVRSYRDNVLGRAIGFGRAFAVGTLIAAVASVCYVATWEVIYFKYAPDFPEQYREHTLAEARAKGSSPDELAKKKARLDRFAELYRNPAYNVAVTFAEPMPVGLVIALVSAGVLSRRKTSSAGSRTSLAEHQA